MAEQRRSLAYDEWNRLLQDGAFEDALAALREVVEHLEVGNLRLEDAVKCYEAGSLLARRCEQLLDEAELRVTRLEEDAAESGGQLGLLND